MTTPNVYKVMNTKKPFEHVVTEYGPMVLRVCRAVLGPMDADDAWSATFLSAMKAYPALAPDANVQAWLVTISHRKALDITRSQNRTGRLASTASPPRYTTSSTLDTHHVIWRYVNDLPLKQRHVVAYRFVGGLSYKEIATILGGTTDAARRAGADGLNTLRKALAHHDYPGELL
jgi:RNA polymerase sigma factor (sigma-70 family)